MTDKKYEKIDKLASILNEIKDKTPADASLTTEQIKAFKKAANDSVNQQFTEGTKLLENNATTFKDTIAKFTVEILSLEDTITKLETINTSILSRLGELQDKTLITQFTLGDKAWVTDLGTCQK